MSRTTLCGITAAILAVLSVGVMVLRYNVMGDEVDLPSGPNVWKVTMTAQAHAATWRGRPVGTFGTFGMFSLYPTKNMTSGEGGMVSCATDEVARMVKLLRNQGMERRY